RQLRHAERIEDEGRSGEDGGDDEQDDRLHPAATTAATRGLEELVEAEDARGKGEQRPNQLDDRLEDALKFGLDPAEAEGRIRLPLQREHRIGRAEGYENNQPPQHGQRAKNVLLGEHGEPTGWSVTGTGTEALAGSGLAQELRKGKCGCELSEWSTSATTR